MDIEAGFELLKESEDADLLSEQKQNLETFKKGVAELEIKSFLSGKFDTSNCFVSIFAGAGGTDAQDWTQLLLRMYLRWFEKKGFTVEVIDESLGEEAGLKSVTLDVKGDYAYGLLKHEAGVHRLVRISPFNANDKRQTSFAAVDVVPQVDKQTEISIDVKDLKIDTYRSSGAGGQHVNKTDSAVRITHLPTGLVVTSQHSRSQISNREMAMSILMSRLAKLMEEQHIQYVNELRGDVQENAWGHQIRSYVFHPYKLVKDLRTNYETSNVQDVMDGELDPFIEASLRESCS